MLFSALLSLIILWIKITSQLIELTPSIISSLDKEKKTIALIYYASKEVLLLKSIENLQKEYTDYLFGYVDTIISASMISFFKITNLNQTGFAIYNFNTHEYYVEENISSIKDVKDVLDQALNNSLNWSSQSVIEKIGWYITGKRLGQRAHTMFTFILCIIAIAVFTIVNIYAKRMERMEIKEKLHTE